MRNEFIDIEKSFIEKICALGREEKQLAKSILLDIKRMKTEGKDGNDMEVIVKVAELTNVLG